MKNQPCPGLKQVNKFGVRNYCLSQLFIQSIDQLLIYDTSKAIPLTYKLLSSPDSTDPYPIMWTSSKEAIFPFDTNFDLYDDGYNYVVSTKKQ